VRAARLHEIGGTPRVDEIDEPGGDDVLAVTASSLNPVDISTGTGRFYGGVPGTPYVIGSEAVGRTADGKRLWYYAKETMAERVALLQPDRAVEIPDGVDDHLALACGTAGLTGWLAVSWCANVTPEDTVLVLGASGTLGATAVQGAKLLGANRVIGAARRVEAVPEAADEVVALEGDYELPQATVVIDGLWGEPAARALAAAALGVRFVQLGQSAGASATLESSWVRGKVVRILGHSLHNVPAGARAAGYRELCTHARDGRIRFDIEAYALDRIAEAWTRQASGSPGVKIVVDLER
jgi:NADPH:quinone reductase-like Zn-dependent oxidoreductase